jgi:hypothetical protein
MMRRTPILIALVLCAACGSSDPSATEPAADSTRSASSTGASAVAAARDDSSPARGATKQAFGQRTGELTNPDDSSIVLLYYDLAGIAPPIDQWVEEDARVAYAPGPDKASRRSTVKQELESARAAVGDIGYLRLTMNANLSAYDPTYGEFTIRALSPSSTVSFKGFRQQVGIRFANARAAQTWTVPPDEAQAVRDKLSYSGATLDALLRITGVQPAPNGGSITTEVVEYELRESRKGYVLARVKVAQ